MPSFTTLRITKWALDAASKLVKARIRLQGAEVIEDDMAVIFVVNHFTRLETFILPWILYKNVGSEVWSLGAAELFQGAGGKYLEALGSISTKDPDRDRIIVRSLLKGEHPWMIFPEGAMIKDKKVIDYRGDFAINYKGKRRPPHKGAAALAIRAEYYRHKIDCLAARPDQEDLKKALELFELPSVEKILEKRTVIVPVNVTYYPIRAHENMVLRLVERFSSGELTPRSMEELSVEGTVLSEDTDIDIVLGEPIDVREYLQRPEYASLMACGLKDMEALETNPVSLFNDVTRDLLSRHMQAIYQLTTVNPDHILAMLVRYQHHQPATVREYRNRLYRCVEKIRALKNVRLHPVFAESPRHLIYDEEAVRFEDFFALCLNEGVLRFDGEGYWRLFARDEEPPEFHEIRQEALSEVLANEIEPLTDVVKIIRNVARQSPQTLRKKLREEVIAQEAKDYETAYAKFYVEGKSKSSEIGQPFLLRPRRPKGGVVLAHGYLSAPAALHALAEYLYQKGYLVYGVRLAGHGTSPEDLEDQRWEDWYESYNRGYVVARSYTEKLYLGGFSTGGCLALLAAADKGLNIDGVFSICAPMKVQNYAIHLAPSVVTLNKLLRKINKEQKKWTYVVNQSENPEVNYSQNPLTGVRELIRLIDALGKKIEKVQAPALVIQSNGDTIVDPVSGQLIFDQLASSTKELLVMARDRHDIINGLDAEDVYERVHHFLQRAARR